jgi:TetR/AcrR family mexXY operon transcriptional repressor
MARKTKDDTEKTVAAILDGAERAFLDKGVANTTVADIAKQAGVSKGAVYGHYKGGKIEVCVAMCERAIGEVREPIHPVKTVSNMESLLQWGLTHLGLCQNPSSLRNVMEILYLKCEENPEYEPVISIRRRWDDHSYLAMRRLIRRAIKSGELSANLEVEQAIDFLMSIMTGIFSTLWWTDRLKDEQEKIKKLMLAGLDAVRDSKHLRATPA